MADSLPILTTSERSLAKKCAQAWWWRYREGLVKRGETADALWFGIGVHEALAAWYLKGKKRGPHPAETFSNWHGEEVRYIRASLSERESEWYDEPKYEEAGQLGVAMLEGYIEKYSRDDNWDVIAIETPFRVSITRQGKTIGKFWSTFDGVYRDTSDGQVYLMEHKTAAAIRTSYLEIDDQGGSYFAVASNILQSRGILGPSENIAGITYNFLRKAMPDDRPVNENGLSLNKDGTVSKCQPVPNFHRQLVERSPSEVRTQMGRLSEEIAVMNAMRSGIIPVTKTPTKNCPNFCEFWDLCCLHERGSNRAIRAMKHSTFSVRDPYDRYRKSSSE
jgi:PD-(D/E)XK nuclease superfamily